MRAGLFVGLSLLSQTTWAQPRLPKGAEEVNSASALIVRGDYVSSEPLLRRAVVDAPNDPYAHYNLAAVLRATGRNSEAVGEYRLAKTLFEHSGASANGEGDVANCLYGIALAQESRGDPQASAQAWRDYVHFAARFRREQPAVAIAREHIQVDDRLARLRPPPLGPQRASRPDTTF